jgi:hypothetical protein
MGALDAVDVRGPCEAPACFLRRVLLVHQAPQAGGASAQISAALSLSLSLKEPNSSSLSAVRWQGLLSSQSLIFDFRNFAAGGGRRGREAQAAWCMVHGAAVQGSGPVSGMAIG